MACAAALSANAQFVDPPEVRAQLNSMKIATNLSGAPPELARLAVASLAKHSMPREDDRFPVFVFESDQGTILYYEGMPSFTDKPVSQLIDDDGKRFGLAALEKAKKSKGGWHSVKLSLKSYRMYCHSLAPFVVCSLVP